MSWMPVVSNTTCMYSSVEYVLVRRRKYARSCILSPGISVLNEMVQRTSNDSIYFGSIQAYGDPGPSWGVLNHELS